MLAKGLLMADIVELTGLSESDIQALQSYEAPCAFFSKKVYSQKPVLRRASSLPGAPRTGFDE